MGIGSSLNTSKAVYLEINGNIEKIVFSLHSSTRDIHELIYQVAKVSRHSAIALRSSDGAYITVSPTMPQNNDSDPYIVEFETTSEPSTSQSAQPSTELAQGASALQMLEHIANQFNKALQKEDPTTSELIERIKTLERRMDVEGLKSVEIDKCQKSIESIKGQIYEAQKKFIDYNRLSDEPTSVAATNTRQRLRVTIPTYIKYTLSQETIEYLKQPTFDIWHWEPNEMLSLLEHMYHELGLVKEFSINGVTLKKWLLCIQENYRNNPFHNFRHCFCVTQMMYGMIHLCKLHEQISKEDIGILLTACICHDLDHPGYNNTYQINAKTELAIRYNDISPLENHHCAVAFKILGNPDTNIFANVDTETFKRIRSGITMLILATDMARHAEILDVFKQFCDEEHFDINDKDHLDSGIITLILATDMARHSEIMESFKEKLETFDYNSQDDLLLLKMVLIKCCDISNEVRPMEISEPWLDCLLEEYFNQSDKEKEEGLPVAPFMDREKVTKPTAQIGFIKFVLLPMFEQVAKLFPQLQKVMVDPLRRAREHWENLKHQDDLRKQQT